MYIYVCSEPVAPAWLSPRWVKGSPERVTAASSGIHTRWWEEQASSLALSDAPVCGVRRLPEGSRRDTGGVFVTPRLPAGWPESYPHRMYAVGWARHRVGGRRRLDTAWGHMIRRGTYRTPCARGVRCPVHRSDSTSNFL